MNIPKAAIERAIEGGWKLPHVETEDELAPAIRFYVKEWQKVALNPSFWQSLGKALGWMEDDHCVSFGSEHPRIAARFGGMAYAVGTWQYNASRFYDLILTDNHIADGRTCLSTGDGRCQCGDKAVDAYWKEILTSK